MNRMIIRTILREIRNNKSRFLSIFLIVFIGVGFFGGIRASGPDMQISADEYFDQKNLMDFRIVSTFGFDDNDLNGLRMLNGVKLYPSYFTDCYAQYGAENVVVRAYSLENYEEQEMNRVTLEEGRMPVNPNECIVDAGTIKYDIPLNTVITLSSGDEDTDIHDTLENTQYTVVGKFTSPLYVDATDRGKTSIGAGSVNTVIYLPQDNFISEYYSEVYLRFSSLGNLNCYSDEYQDIAESIREQISQCADNREMNRYRQLYDEASDKIERAEKRLDRKENQYKKRLKKSKDTLDASRLEIDSGKAEINEAQALLDAQMNQIGDGSYAQDGTDAITEGTDEIDRLRDRIDNSEQLYESLGGEPIGTLDDEEEVDEEYRDRDEWDADEETPDEPDEDFDIDAAGDEDESDGEDVLEETEDGSPEDGEETDGEEQEYLDFSNLDLENPTEETLDEMRSIILDARRELVSMEDKLNEAIDRMPEMDGSVEDMLAELSSQQEMIDSQRDALTILEQEYEEGLENYKKKKERVEQAIKEARRKLRRQERKLQELEEPKWYIYDREDNPGYREYHENADRINNIGKVFPVFFLLVAALVCLTCMSRMIDEERVSIGTLKAIGYSDGTILARYLIYALLATVLGAVLGLMIGFQLFPRVIIYSYSILYRIPVQVTPFHWGLAAASVLSAVVCVGLTVGYSCRSVLRGEPARLMRPKAPAAGKRVLLEKVPFIWNHMSFSRKVTARNIFRYKKRMLMTIVGIAGCTALTLTGFGLRDSIRDVVQLQYGAIWKYDAMLYLDGATGEDLSSVNESTRAYDPDGISLNAMAQSEDVRNGAYELTANLIVPEEENRLDQFVELRSRGDQNRYTLLDDGVMLTEKAAKLLHVSAGDTISIVRDDIDYELTIQGVVENYANHYIYMAPALYMKTFAQVPEYNAVFVRYGQTMNEQQENGLNAAWLQEPAVLNVSYSADLKDKFNDIMNILNVVILVLIISAGVLALVVLYNLSVINITERKREIATLKVLGFKNRETTGYIFRENLFMALIGIAFGLGAGRLLTYYVVTVAEIDIAMFGRTIYPASYGMAALITFGFFLLVTLVMSVPLRRIDMVESLKSVE